MELIEFCGRQRREQREEERRRRPQSPRGRSTASCARLVGKSAARRRGLGSLWPQLALFGSPQLAMSTSQSSAAADRREREAEAGIVLCGINGCLLEDRHQGMCLFPESASRGRRGNSAPPPAALPKRPAKPRKPPAPKLGVEAMRRVAREAALDGTAAPLLVRAARRGGGRPHRRAARGGAHERRRTGAVGPVSAEWLAPLPPRCRRAPRRHRPSRGCASRRRRRRRSARTAAAPSRSGCSGGVRRRRRRR